MCVAYASEGSEADRNALEQSKFQKAPRVAKVAVCDAASLEPSDNPFTKNVGDVKACYTPPPPPPFAVAPTNASLSLSPFGVSVEFSVTSPTFMPGGTLSTTFGYDQSTRTRDGAYGFMRYGAEQQFSVANKVLPVTFAVQGGMWLHDPHLAGVRMTARGLKVYLLTTSNEPQLTLRTSLELALLQFADSRAALFDSRAEATVRTLQTDQWGYPASGWQGTLTGLWSATASAPSRALWGDGLHIMSLSSAWRMNLGLRAGYRPAWPIPFTATSEFAALGTVGMSSSVNVGLKLLPELFTLDRFTFEPRLRTWVDRDLHTGVDLTLSADTTLTDVIPVTVSSTLGYTDKVWLHFGLRVSP